MINFVYTLCSSTPGQIQHGQFIRVLSDMIRDQVRILYLLFLCAGVTCMKIQDGVVNRAKTLETLLRITGFGGFLMV